MKNNAAKNRVTFVLIALNIVCFILSEIVGETSSTDVLVTVGGAYTPFVTAGEYWRLFTSMFLHAGIRHLLNNMLLLYVLGTSLEHVLGSAKYAAIYLLGGLIGSVVEYQHELRQGIAVVSVGASGCVYAIIGAAIFVVLRNKGRIEGLSLRQLLTVLLFSLYYGFVGANVANAAHLGGLAGGFVLAALLYRKEETRQDDFFSGGSLY